MHFPTRFALLIGVLAAIVSISSHAAPDEIQVYDDELDEPGKYGVELHLNHVLSGGQTPEFEGAIPTHHVTQATPEFSYGINESWEAGLYFPPTAITSDGKVHFNGIRPRLKYIAPKKKADGFFWGVNTELGYFADRKISEEKFGGEIRPILGYRKGAWTGIVNPILDFTLSGNESRTPEFEPAAKVSYQVNKNLAIGVEHYASLGHANNLTSWHNSPHNTFIAMDLKHKKFDLNLGIGRGNELNNDRNVVKAIVALPF